MYGRTTDGKRARPRTSQLQISRLPLHPRLCNGNTNLVTSKIGLIWRPHGGGGGSGRCHVTTEASARSEEPISDLDTNSP